MGSRKSLLVEIRTGRQGAQKVVRRMLDIPMPSRGAMRGIRRLIEWERRSIETDQIIQHPSCPKEVSR